MPLDPLLKIVLDQMQAQGGPKLHTLTPESARKAFESMPLPKQEIEIARVEDRSIDGPAGPVGIRVYRPTPDAVLPALLYFHGGGWVVGSLETHDASCRALAAGADCVVVAVDYRLAPEHPYPIAVEEGAAVLRWLAEQAEELGIDATRIAVGGDSAGGNLAAVTALRTRDRGGPALCAQLLIYPVTDADLARESYVKNGEGYFLETDTMRWFWDLYLPDPDRRSEAYASPLRAENLAELPPAFVLTAEFDPLRDEGEAYAERLREAGIPTRLTRYDGMIHGFFVMGAFLEGARRAVADATEHLRSAFELPG